MNTFDLFRTIVGSTDSFETKLHFDALAAVARESVTAVPPEGVCAASTILHDTNDVGSEERAALIERVCASCGVGTMDARDVMGGLAHMHILAARAVVHSIPQINRESLRMSLAAVADGLLRDASYLMMGDLTEQVADKPAPASGSLVPT